MSTDKVTRVLIMYQHLIHGKKIDKQMFMLEHDIDRRSFERDIDDIRLFLSENYTGSELLYDRDERAYYMTNLTVPHMYLPEAYAIAKILLDSGAFRRDEIDGMLSALISALTPSDAEVLERECGEGLKVYREPEHKKALLKIIWDLSRSLNKRRLRLHFYDGSAKNIVPLGITFTGRRFVLNALCRGEECEIFAEDILSFDILGEYNE